MNTTGMSKTASRFRAILAACLGTGIALFATSPTLLSAGGRYLSPEYRASLIAKHVETDPSALLDVHLESTVIDDQGREAVRSILDGEEEREEFLAMIDASDEVFFLHTNFYYSLTGRFPNHARRVLILSPPRYTLDVFQNIGAIARGERELPFLASTLDGEAFDLAIRGLMGALEPGELDRLAELASEAYSEKSCETPADFELLYAAYVNQTNDFWLFEHKLRPGPDSVQCPSLSRNVVFHVMEGLDVSNPEARDLVLEVAKDFAHNSEYNGTDFDLIAIARALYAFRNDREVVRFVHEGLLFDGQQGQGRFTRATETLLTILRDSDVRNHPGRTPIEAASQVFRIRGLQIMDEYLHRPEGYRYPAAR